jgi:nucleotide-binding universal stress UspA family protein
MKHVLVPIDGSAIASRALDFAIERAKIYGARVTVAFSVNRIAVVVALASPYTYVDPTPLFAALDAEADVILGAGEARIKGAGAAGSAVKLDGPPAPAILACARETKADLIVIGTHGRRGFDRFAVGSTAEDVIRASGVPVFVVPLRAGPPKIGPLAQALVAVDGSPAADAGLRFACELARLESTRLNLCTVVETPGFHWDDLERSVFLQTEMEEEAQRLLDESRARALCLGVEADTIFRRGDAAAEIIASAQSAKADCIFIGTHGRAGLPRFILGSVAEGVLRTSPLPVCTVRHR